MVVAEKSMFIGLHDCQFFLVNFILELSKCFLPEHFLLLLSLPNSVRSKQLELLFFKGGFVLVQRS